MRILGYMLAIPFITIFALLDKVIINKGSFTGYLIVCAFEYAIFWLGIYVGLNAEKAGVKLR